MFFLQTADNLYQVSNAVMYIVAAAFVAIVLTLYILRSLGVWVLAKRKNVKHAFLAWIPVAWIYIVGVLIGKVVFFGRPVKNIGIAVLIIGAIYTLMNLFYNVSFYAPFVYSFLCGDAVIINTAESTIAGAAFSYYEWFDSVIYYVGVVSELVGLINLFMMLNLYIGIFKKYNPAHYILYSILSVLGLGGIFLFVIRNKEPMKYTDYVRARYQSFYGNNPNNPFGAGGSQQAPPDDPFREYAKPQDVNPGDPFSDFPDGNGSSNSNGGDNDNTNGGSGNDSGNGEN